MPEPLLNREDYELLRRLPRDLEIAQADASVMGENRADCESIRRGIRDRLKPYVEKKSVLDTGLVQRAINTLVYQNEAIKEDRTEIERLKEALIGREPGDVFMQDLVNAGINAWALELLCESFIRLDYKQPLKFKFKGIIFHFGVNYHEALQALEGKQ